MYNKKANKKGTDSKPVLTRWQRTVKAQVLEGDQTVIHIATGYSKSLVSKVLSGKRNNDRIWKLEAIIQNNRKELVKTLKSVA